MSSIYKVPGVYAREVVLKPPPRLETGIPGFVGYVVPQTSGGTSATTPAMPVALNRRADFDTLFGKLTQSGRPESYLADAVSGFFLNGGARCYVAGIAWTTGKTAAYKMKELSAAVDSLSKVDDLDLVAVPDAMTLYEQATDATVTTLDSEAVLSVQVAMLRHCQTYEGRLALLDALPSGDNSAVVIDQRSKLVSREPLSSINAALYYPWLKTYRDAQGLLIPPCGHLAGIIARSDASSGFYKSPANEELLGVQDLETDVTDELQGELNPLGINCLRAFPGRGLRVWGARTLSVDPNWCYISVRRLFLTLYRWINFNMSWVNFEPNTPSLWTRIESELSTYLTELWRAGAIKGGRPEQAFYVKCDAETNPAEVREAGQTIMELGLAPGLPAEFVALRIVLHTGTQPR